MHVPRCILVPAAMQQLARAVCLALAEEAAEGMFVVGVASTQAGPATHYICSFRIPIEYAALLPYPELAPGTMELALRACEGFAQPPTEAQLLELLSSSEITDETGYAMLARRGMAVVTGAAA